MIHIFTSKVSALPPAVPTSTTLQDPRSFHQVTVVFSLFVTNFTAASSVSREFIHCSLVSSLFIVGKVISFLLFQQTAVQSTILFLLRIVDKILQTCSVVKNAAATAATIQEGMAVSERFK